MDWIKDNRRLLTFFAVVLASVSLNFYLFWCSQSSYKASQKMIVRQYNAQILKCDKAINGVIKYVPAKQPARSDSLYVDLQTQYLKTLEEQKLFQESIKSMLELEFNKIQNDYETQEIWIGLITIVFLIFSFYSIMKSEQFEKQCQEDAKRIHDWMKSCKDILESIDAEKKSKLQEITNEFSTWKKISEGTIKEQTNALVSKELQSFREEKKEKLEEISNRWNTSLDEKSRDVIEKIQTLEDATKAECAELTKNFLSKTELKLNQEIQRLLNDFDLGVKKLEQTIDKRIEAYIESSGATEEDIDQLFDESFGTGGAMKDASTDRTSDNTNQEDIENE